MGNNIPREKIQELIDELSDIMNSYYSLAKGESSILKSYHRGKAMAYEYCMIRLKNLIRES